MTSPGEHQGRDESTGSHCWIQGVGTRPGYSRPVDARRGRHAGVETTPLRHPRRDFSARPGRASDLTIESRREALASARPISSSNPMKARRSCCALRISSTPASSIANWRGFANPRTRHSAASVDRALRRAMANVTPRKLSGPLLTSSDPAGAGLDPPNCRAFDSLSPEAHLFGLTVHVARVPAAPFCETPPVQMAPHLVIFSDV